MTLDEFRFGDRVRYSGQWPEMMVLNTTTEPDRVIAAWVTDSEKLPDGRVRVSTKAAAFHPNWLERIAG